MLFATAPLTQIIFFKASQHSASVVLRPPRLRSANQLDIIISSPHDLRRGPVKYEGGYKQQKLAAAAFPFNSRQDFFAAGLALNAGGGRGCVVRARRDVCHTRVAGGFLRLRHSHWKRLEITLFKPARQHANVRVSLRVVPA